MIGSVWLWVSSAQAAVWSVKEDGSGQFSSIQAAINAAASGDTIEVGPGVWREAISTGSKRLTVTATGGAAATTLDATGAENAVQAWGELTLEGFTLANQGGRGLGIWGGKATLRDLIFDDIGESWVYGAALYAGTGAWIEGAGIEIAGGTAYQGMIYASGATLSLQDLTVDGAEAAANGTALMAYSSTVTVDGGALERLYAAGTGGAIFLSSSTLTLKNVDVYGNLTDYGHGSGLYAEYSDITVEGGSFSLNNAINYADGYDGGAMYLTGSSALLDGVTLSDNAAYSGGAIRSVGSTVSMLGGTVTGNRAYYGGGAYGSETNSLLIEDTTWSDNVGSYGAGAIYQDGRFTLTVEEGVFSDNEATYGHGGAVYTSYAGSASFTGTVFTDNTAYYSGGGVHSSYTYGADTYTDCSFENNESVYGQGAAISANAYVKVSITGSRFAYNEATSSHAGAIYAYYAPLTITDSELIGNRAGGQGGGIYSYYAWGHERGALRVERVAFQSNEALYQGGAIASVYDDVRILDSTFTTNDVDLAGMGGAVFLDYTLRAIVRRSRFIGNNAGYGGALYSSRANLSAGAEQWSNNIFQENTAVIGGSAVWVDSPGAELRNSVFVGSAAVDTAGSIALVASSLTAINNIFARSPAGVALYAYDDESVTGSRLAHNAFFDITDGIAGGAFTEEAALGEGSLQLDPLFSAYSPDGKADNDRYVLLRDSLLIDAGDPNLKDPDGSASDIGAWGGPDVVVEDADKDGYDDWIDCDAGAADAHPGGTEVFYDGINQDCLSGSDYDADQDGHDADTHGGDDCDDADPTTVSDCDPADTDTPEDTGAPDGDGHGDGHGSSGGSGGRGCTHVVPPGHLGLAGLVGLVALCGRRRRRGATRAG